jgi:1,4-alpha-glucan branching enzyme
MTRYVTILILLLSFAPKLSAQIEDINNAYRIEGNDIVLYIHEKWSREEQERVLEKYGMKGLPLDTLIKFGHLGSWAKDGWKVERTARHSYKIFKPIADLSGDLKWSKEVVVFSDQMKQVQMQTTATYGFNSFKRTTVFPLKNGSRRFVLFGMRNAREVYLSGTFNNWSTLSTPMTKTDSGWVADVPLKAGKHCYKFIADGQWLHDPLNNHREGDFHGGFNSVYFVTNHEFRLKGYEQAKEVFVAGTFNQWNKRELSLRKVDGGWAVPVYLHEGTFGYRFYVDKKWINDPSNDVVRVDSKGMKNSYIQFGEPLYFKLKGYTGAQRVIVAGEFNRWNEEELVMSKTSVGWELPYVLGPGNYQYKFIADGEWFIDPQNPHKGTLDGHENSVLVVKPNYTFTLKGFKNAKEVHVAGSFNDWQGYTMKPTPEGWSMSIYLPQGKCRYKFVVDGKWIIDPGNPFWEQNEYGTGNSVLWIGPQ